MSCRYNPSRWPLSGAATVALIGGVAALGFGVPVLAQPVAPSAIAPDRIAPETPVPFLVAERVIAPPAASVAQGSGAALMLQPGSVQIAGGFTEMAGANAAFEQRVAGHSLPFAELVAAAQELERAYANAGYVFARVVVPPQRVAPGGPARVEVIDGFVEALDLAGLPSALRPLVASRLQSLPGRRHLTRAVLERAVLLAGEVPGLTLSSALVRGADDGGVRLVVAGAFDRLQARVGADNRLPASVGAWQGNATLVRDGLLTPGDQAYLFAGSGFATGPLRLGMVGAGLRLPLSPTGTTLGAEALFARTEPERPPGAVAPTGQFARGELVLAQPLIRSRRRSLDARLSADLISQSLAAPQFDTVLSRDSYAALRLALAWQEQTREGATALDLTLSHGAATRDSTAAVPFSREGAGSTFTTLQAEARFHARLPEGFALDLAGRAQSAFGSAVFLSEQFALDTPDAVSAFPAGTLNVDSGATLRGELVLPAASSSGLSLAPYLFAAAGAGVIEQPTAVEQASLTAAAAGLGGQFTFGRLPGSAGASAIVRIEVGRQFSNLPVGRDDTRANMSATVKF